MQSCLPISAVDRATQDPDTASGTLTANRLAISVFETYDDIVARCCDAWNFFANDINMVRSITNREYAKAVKA